MLFNNAYSGLVTDGLGLGITHGLITMKFSVFILVGSDIRINMVTFNFIPGSAAWIIINESVEKVIVSHIKVLVDTLKTKTIYRVLLNNNPTPIDVAELQIQTNINNVVSGLNGSFSITGNLTEFFYPGRIFYVDNSSGNNGIWTVQSSIFIAGTTVITVVETIPSTIIDGVLSYSKNQKVFHNQIEMVNFLKQSELIC